MKSLKWAGPHSTCLIAPVPVGSRQWHDIGFHKEEYISEFSNL